MPATNHQDEHTATCPNCGQPAGHALDGCALATLMQTIRERGQLQEDEIQRLQASVDTDMLWEALNSVADRIETGQMSRDTPPARESRPCRP